MAEATAVVPQYDPEQPLWSIMTKSRGGTVSVIRDLTMAQAKKTYERLDPWYGQTSETLTVHKDFLREGYLGMSSGSGGRVIQNGDIEIREVFGPPGWERFEDVTHWPKIYNIYTDANWNVLPPEYQEYPERAAQYHAMVARQAERKKVERVIKASKPVSSHSGWFNRVFGW